MPRGSHVEKVFLALKREGKDPAAAAKIAQAVTGLSLVTGKKPVVSKTRKDVATKKRKP